MGKQIQHPSDSVKVKGIFRLQLVDPDGNIAGDSGWVENAIMPKGFQEFIAGAVCKGAGSSQVNYAALGTSTVATNDTALSGELTGSKRATAVGVTSSSTDFDGIASFTAVFNSTQNLVTGTGSIISNIGLFASSSGGTMFAGTSYTASTLASNQNVNVTYQINFT